MPKRVPEINGEMLRQAEELAGYGLSLPQIAAVLGFSERTIHTRKNESEALAAALARGKAKAAGIVGKALFQRAKDGDIPAIRWWEMTREGRSERMQAETKVEVVNDAETDARLAKALELFERGDKTRAVEALKPRDTEEDSVDVGSVGET